MVGKTSAKFVVIASLVGVAAACSAIVSTSDLDSQTDTPLDGGGTDVTSGVDAGKDGAPPIDSPSPGDTGSDTGAMDAGSDGPTTDAYVCPSGGGPTMVMTPDGCVDSTEVTNAQYNDFLKASPSMSLQPSSCSWNMTYAPSQGFDPTGQADYPVGYVNWCDAYAFCAWAGKRLCGAKGGGDVSFGTPTSALGQWFNACSKAGAQNYPYGASYDSTACNEQLDGGALAPVKSFPKCEGGYAGVYDLAGNIEEWIDSCDGTTGMNDNCHEIGGAFDIGVGACDTLDSDWRAGQFDNVGFRCCAP